MRSPPRHFAVQLSKCFLFQASSSHVGDKHVIVLEGTAYICKDIQHVNHEVQSLFEFQTPQVSEVSFALCSFFSFASGSFFHVSTDHGQVLPECGVGSLSACHPPSALWRTEVDYIFVNNVTELLEIQPSFLGTIVEPADEIDALFYKTYDTARHFDNMKHGQLPIVCHITYINNIVWNGISNLPGHSIAFALVDTCAVHVSQKSRQCCPGLPLWHRICQWHLQT